MGFHETIAADEDARFQQIADELRGYQRARASGGTPRHRALHAKQHVGVVGELVVTADEPHRVGVFAGEPAAFSLYARFSNGSGSVQGDGRPDVRGIALKLVGVPGKKLIPGLEDAATQDFLFIAQSALPVRDPYEFMVLARALKDGPLWALPRLLAGLGVRRGSTVLGRIAKIPKVSSFATHPFFTAAPISFGASAAKLGLFPVDAAPASPTRGSDALRDDLVARLAAGPVRWSLRAQLFIDDRATPIEDASIEWKAPWVEVAQITLRQQDVASASGQAVGELVDRLSFDPWHAIAAHRPLGSIMRARAVAYRESVLARQAAPEPDAVLGQQATPKSDLAI